MTNWLIINRVMDFVVSLYVRNENSESVQVFHKESLDALLFFINF